MKTIIAIVALMLSAHAFAADECVEVGQMYYSAATQRDQAIQQDAVTKNIRKNFASLSNHYNLDLVVTAAFKHYDVSPEMLQGLASAKCEDDHAQATSASASATPAVASGYGKTFDACMARSSGVTADMLDCLGAETRRQDAQLNANYRAAMKTLPAAKQSELASAERAWIKQRDSKCAPDTDGGTVAQVNSASCVLEMTAQRVKELLAERP
jgi:uncharacterized protein YecT (DUF1311 family)